MEFLRVCHFRFCVFIQRAKYEYENTHQISNFKCQNIKFENGRIARRWIVEKKKEESGSPLIIIYK